MADAVKVELFGSLAAQTGGERTVEVEAGNIRELLSALADRFPGLAPQIERGVSVSIDGRVFSESLLQELGPENEIILLPQVRGG